MKIVLILTLILATPLHAASVNVSDKLHLYQTYRQQLRKFQFHQVNQLRREIIAQRDTVNKDLLERLDKVIAPPFVDSIAYHILIKKNNERLEEALSFLMLNRLLIVKQASEATSSAPEVRERSLALLTKWSGMQEWDENILRFALEMIQHRARIISEIGSAQAIVEAIEQTHLISDHLEVEAGIKNALMAEPVGAIEGNIVSMSFKNDRSLARAKSLQSLASKPSSDEARMAAAAELKKDHLVKNFYEMIENAKTNLIVLSPLTSGVSEDGLLQAFTDKFKSDEKFKMIFIAVGDISPRLLNVASHYRNRFAIMTIPDTVLRDGPLSWQTFIPTPDLKFKTQYGLGLLALSDTASDRPAAFMTSRRFVDHPHAYSFEQSMAIVGPAAGLMPQLLHANLRKLIPNYTNVSEFFPAQSHYPSQGQESVRLTVDSARLGARDDRALAVKFLLEAKEEVLLDQHMLYDRAIVDTLIKLKIRKPDLQVLVLLDTNLDIGMNGLPNSIFMAEMKRFGIEIKGRRALLWEETSSEDANLLEKHGINHRNLIIRDKQFVFMGTGPFTGNFEKRSPISFGVQVSSAMSAELADNFMRDWNNPDATYELDIENFQARFDDVELSKKVSSFLNDVFSLLLRAFD